MKTILYVDDDIELQKTMLEYVFKQDNWKVVLANNLYDAKELAQQQTFDTYLVDGHFPLYKGGHDRDDENVAFKFYEEVENLRGKPLNYIIFSGDGSLEEKCEEKGIRFLKKGRLDAEEIKNAVFGNIGD